MPLHQEIVKAPSEPVHKNGADNTTEPPQGLLCAKECALKTITSLRLGQAESGGIVLAAVYWARAPRVVLPDRALCLPTFCHSLLTVNKSSSSSSSSPRTRQARADRLADDRAATRHPLSTSLLPSFAPLARAQATPERCAEAKSSTYMTASI